MGLSSRGAASSGGPGGDPGRGVLVCNGLFRRLGVLKPARPFPTDFVLSNRTGEFPQPIPSGTLVGRIFLSPTRSFAAACRVGSCRTGNASRADNACRRGREDSGNNCRGRTSSRAGTGGRVSSCWSRYSTTRSDRAHGPRVAQFAGRADKNAVIGPTIRGYRRIDRGTTVGAGRIDGALRREAFGGTCRIHHGYG